MATRKAATMRKLPVHLKKAELDGEFEGWEFEFRSNPPMGKWAKAITKVSAFDEDEPSTAPAFMDGMGDVLEAMIVKWNYVDEEGVDLPVCRNSIDLLPSDLISLTFNKLMESMNQAPLVTSGN